jgi:hypothetical protein
MIRKLINLILGPEKEKKVIVDCSDSSIGGKFTLLDLIQSLEYRVEQLERENVETTNILYEIMNTLDSLELKINGDKNDF